MYVRAFSKTEYFPYPLYIIAGLGFVAVNVFVFVLMGFFSSYHLLKYLFRGEILKRFSPKIGPESADPMLATPIRYR